MSNVVDLKAVRALRAATHLPMPEPLDADVVIYSAIERIESLAAENESLRQHVAGLDAMVADTRKLSVAAIWLPIGVAFGAILASVLS